MGEKAAGMTSPQRDPAPRAWVTPIGIPGRTDLWYRVQLAKAVLAHREYTRETAVLVLAILDGAQIYDLIQPHRGQ